MTDTRQVLLARPHPFIVAEMLPLLTQGGYSAVKLERLADLPQQAKGAKGAVISLALASSIAESPEQVFAKLRRSAPSVPVLFAAMLDYSMVSRKLEDIAQHAGVRATIIDIEGAGKNPAALGKPQTFLYVSKDDLALPQRKALTARMILQHFE
ncbi:MAG: hypothetical protein RRB22_02465 [Gammaproteobacteria bacterium]|nr:hypothetical protein [Gammaproteobacteria bacterium]